MTSGTNKLELYVHIPFCVEKCAYCDFLSAPADVSVRQTYLKMLRDEIVQKAEQYHSYEVPSLFIGGGTPSVYQGEEIGLLMETLQSAFHFQSDAEITIECNPGTLNSEKAADYKRSGINRVSLGLQSTLDSELKLLGRIHCFEEFLESYQLLRQAGIRNINVDLMSGLPGQKLGDWEHSLRTVAELEPEHISAYSLMVEEGTAFYSRYGEDARRREEGLEPKYLPDEDTERQMYHRTKMILGEYGYHPYEISNYAKPGMECQHNMGYWTRVNYLGLGLGSASLVENERFSNTSVLTDYMTGQTSPIDKDQLSLTAQQEEFMFLGLRLTEGVSKDTFRASFNQELTQVYGKEIKKLISQGLLQETQTHISLTREGISVSNYVLSQFIK